MDEKAQTVDRIVAEDQAGITGYVIVCRRGRFSSHPFAVVDKCDNCDAPIIAAPVSVEKRKDGFFLLCRECFQRFSEKK